MKYKKKTAFIFINFSHVLDLYHTQFPQFHHIKYIRLFEIPRYNEYTLSLYFDDNMTKNVELPISSDLTFWKIQYFSFSEVKRRNWFLIRLIRKKCAYYEESAYLGCAYYESAQ